MLPEILLVAAVYFVLARLSLLFALENSNVSPVWPPAGFAMAVMILYGYRAAWGIWLGAFIVNLAVFASNHSADFTTELWASSFIGVGNTVEAMVGAYIFRKSVALEKQHNFFLKTNSIFWFLYTAIIMCLVGSAMNNNALLFKNNCTRTISYNNIHLVGRRFVGCPSFYSIDLGVAGKTHKKFIYSKWKAQKVYRIHTYLFNNSYCKRNCF